MSKEGSVFDMGAGDSVPDWNKKKKSPAKPATGVPAQNPQAKPQPGRSAPVPSQQRRTPPVSNPPAAKQWNPTYSEAPAPKPTSPAKGAKLPSPGRGTGTVGLPTNPSTPAPQPQRPPQQPSTPRLPDTPSLPAAQSHSPAPVPAPPPAPAPTPAPVQEQHVQQGYQQPTPPAPGAAPERIQQEWGPAPVPSRPPHAMPNEEEYEDFYDDDDDYEKPSRSRAKTSASDKGTKSKSAKSKNKRKGTKKNKKDYDPGQKTRANVIRWVTLGLLGVLCLLGVRSVVFPPQFPGPDQVLNRVQEGLELTDFPADRAEAFVIGFTRAYLTVPSRGSSSEREAELSNYAPVSLVDSLGARSGNVEQSIVDGPYISGTRYVTDEDAVFTVAAKMNNGYWIYLDVPVYYNHQTRAFAISGVPAAVAQPRLSSVPAIERTWTADRDEDLTKQVSSDLERYFIAWSSPDDPDSLRIWTTASASPAAKAPIQGVEFVSLSGVEVSTSDGATVDGRDSRIAYATVRWRIVPPITEDTDLDELPEPATYDMSYELIIALSGEEEAQWRVSNIRGGIRSSSALSGGETEEETKETE